MVLTAAPAGRERARLLAAQELARLRTKLRAVAGRLDEENRARNRAECAVRVLTDELAGLNREAQRLTRMAGGDAREEATR